MDDAPVPMRARLPNLFRACRFDKGEYANLPIYMVDCNVLEEVRALIDICI
jgi:hypothetical protein